MAQNLTFATNCVTNPQTLTPPALTPVTTNLTISSNGNNTANTDQQNKNKGSESGSMTGIEEMDSIMMIMEWRDGIGTLPGSDLKFRIDEFGHLDMVQEYDLEVEASTTNGVKQEVNTSEKNSSQESDKTEVKDEAKESNESESLLKCINCGQRGAANTFLRQGRFCSKACATLVSTDLKLLTKRSTELSSLKAQEDEKKSEVNNSEVIKSRKQIIEPVVYQTENSNQTIEGDESTEDTNEEVEDVETNAGKFVENVVSMAFSWRQYLNKTNSTAAPVKCFTKSQTFPEMKNNFKVGMKLEGVDPQHPSKFCVLTVAEVLGHRIRLHFDGYKELFDFWVNYDNDFIFAAGFCEQTNRKLEPPVGISDDEFNWNQYLQQTRAVAAPKHLFSSSSSHQSLPPNGFQIGMKLEAVDRANTALVCVATIADIIDNWLLIHFDGWDDSYDYWAETTSPFIHPVNWCRTKGRSLTPPKDYYRSSEKFSWEEYLSESKSHAVSPRLFKTRSSNNFKVGLKLEAVDKRNPRLVRVCTVSHRQSHCIKLHFDGWDEKYDYWVDDDLPDIHPVNWCHKTGHPLQPPPPSDLKAIKERPEGMALCPTPGCLGMGHIRSCKYGNHSSVVSCPYTDSRLEYELPDRLGNRNTDGMATEDPDESQVSPSQSPSPSDSNSINSAQKSQKSVKSQQMCGTKAGRKRKLGSSPSNGANDANGANGPVSPSTNSESAKHSRPSTPSSITNLSSLQHSIFAMRMSQQQQEAPVCWDRHSKTTLPGIDKTKSKEVLSWTPTKVSDFIDQIPGCESVGQVFAEQLIDGEAFLLLNQNDIVKILNLKLGPAIKIFNSILVIRDNAINEDNV
ncbi:unnamed protein product [Oppiella nova]|uniref:SAM domain-containing protein n=1 Tax=Oppiella nova TaxID=334625 RepID=A0A7R9QRM0_9ACAR|nr:unnamed protein product [Oppiella nova]CAG2172863.1 unnamed protein product [Oppiella nova]